MHNIVCFTTIISYGAYKYTNLMKKIINVLIISVLTPNLSNNFCNIIKKKIGLSNRALTEE